MKRIITIIAVACVAFAMPAQAQVKFGLKGGLNLTAISTDGSSQFLSNQTGFFVGPTVKFTVPIVGLSFDASALYDQRQGKYTGNGDDRTFKVQTVQIPINIRYGVGLSSLVNVFAFAGPQFGFNIGDKSKDLLSAKWNLKSSNISGNVGIGATVFSKLQITANYNFQLSKTGEMEYLATPETETKKVNFNSWQLGLGYFF